jgi:hypothetical protein
MVKVYVKSGNSKGTFLGEYESKEDALYELAVARDDNDYSIESFNDCYIVEEIEE